MDRSSSAGSFLDAFQGSFTSALRWPQLDALWERLRAAPDGWYIYAIGEPPPERPVPPEDLARFIDRVDALLRRATLRASQAIGKAIVDGPLALDSDRLQTRWREQPVALTVTELWILHALVVHPGHVKNRTQLMEAADIYVDAATITSHIKRIRRKFLTVDPTFDAIEAVYGAGYRWKG